MWRGLLNPSQTPCAEYCRHHFIVFMKAGMVLALGCCKPSPPWLMVRLEMISAWAGSSVVSVSRHMSELVIFVDACVIGLSQK